MSTTTAPSRTAITGMDLAAFLVNDPAASIAFYRDVMGLEPTWTDPEGRGAEFTLADGNTFGVWRDEDTTAPGGCIMFAVADAYLAAEHYRSKGAKLGDVMETPSCYHAFGVDPDGNAICVHQRKNLD